MLTFEEYTRSIDHLVTVGLPEAERLAAAREAGQWHGAWWLKPSDPSSPYLYDRLEAAFYGWS